MPSGKRQGLSRPSPQLAKQTYTFAMQLLGTYAYTHHQNSNWSIMAAAMCRSVIYGTPPPLLIEADRTIIMQYIQQACEHTGHMLSEPKKTKRKK